VLCVYAIVASTTTRIRVRGLRGEALRVIAVGRIAAVVGEHRRAPRPTRPSLRAYHAAVERLARDVPAVVPARFGTLFEAHDELEFVLRTRAATFTRTLRQVRHRLQMTIRVVVDEQEAEPDAVVDWRSGTAYLQSRSARAAQPSRHPSITRLRHAVRRWVRDERVEQRGRVVTVYHLVPRASVDAYRRAAKRAGPSRERLVIGGPFAPYAFADALLR
jgi:hypothetical protein